MFEDFNNKKFAKRLKEIRKAKKLTQEEVCNRTNIDSSNYSKMETGKISPSLKSLYKLIKGTDFVPNDLFEYDHFSNEKELDEMNMKIYHSFSLRKKQSLYKILRALEDFN